MSLSNIDFTKVILPFDGKDWQAWKFKMKALLRARGLLECVEEDNDDRQSSLLSGIRGPATPSSKHGESSRIGGLGSPIPRISPLLEQAAKTIGRMRRTFTKEEHDTYAIIVLSLKGEPLELVQHIEQGNVKAVWLALTREYERKTMSNKLRLIRTLMTMKMGRDQEGRRMELSSYIQRIRMVVRQLNHLGEAVSETLMIAATIYGLEDRFSPMEAVLESQDLTFDQVVERLKDWDENLKNKPSKFKYKHGDHQINAMAETEKRTCFRFRNTGKCKYGKDCMFSHEQQETGSDSEEEPPKGKRGKPKKEKEQTNFLLDDAIIF